MIFHNLKRFSGVKCLDQYYDPLILIKGRYILYISLITVSEDLDKALNVLRTLMLNKEEIEHLINNINEILQISVKNYRTDLDPVTRGLFTEAIKRFYEEAGYTVDEDPGTLKTMMIFLIKLIEEEIKALERGDSEKIEQLRKIQLRFLNTHVRPLLERVAKSNEKLSKAAETLLKIIYLDIELLKDLILGR